MDFITRTRREFLNDPNGHIVIDDGRRYLKRTRKKFDVIVVDPPPPVEAAGSSLLYSKEFYGLAKQHLNPGGILQMWFPGGEQVTAQAVIRSINESFPYVRCFPSVRRMGSAYAGFHGTHRKLNRPTNSRRGCPRRAKKDLLEWNDSPNLPGLSRTRLFHTKFPSAAILNPDPEVQVTDDQPYQ